MQTWYLMRLVAAHVRTSIEAKVGHWLAGAGLCSAGHISLATQPAHFQQCCWMHRPKRCTRQLWPGSLLLPLSWLHIAQLIFGNAAEGIIPTQTALVTGRAVAKPVMAPNNAMHTNHLAAFIVVEHNRDSRRLLMRNCGHLLRPGLLALPLAGMHIVQLIMVVKAEVI